MDKRIKVIKIIDNYTVVINAGSDDGIEDKYEFLIYSLGEELFDPDTNESLGQLENVKGTAIPMHIQPKITTIKSNIFKYSESKKIIRKQGLGLSVFAPNEEIIEPKEKIIQSFIGLEIGDLVKVINTNRRF